MSNTKDKKTKIGELRRNNSYIKIQILSLSILPNLFIKAKLTSLPVPQM